MKLKNIISSTLSIPVCLLCLGCLVYLCNRSYQGIVQYLPADSQLTSPRDNSRCLSGYLKKKQRKTVYTHYIPVHDHINGGSQSNTCMLLHSLMPLMKYSFRGGTQNMQVYVLACQSYYLHILYLLHAFRMFGVITLWKQLKGT